MKKLINSPETLVDDMLEGYVAAYGDLVRCEPGSRIVLRKTPKARGVGLVIGNGSGHEPIAMGWVGHGMLDANAVGNFNGVIFTNIINQNNLINNVERDFVICFF